MPGITPDVKIEFAFDGLDSVYDGIRQLYVYFRPHLFKVLESLASQFELILFTAGTEDYINLVFQAFMQAGFQTPFDYVLTR